MSCANFLNEDDRRLIVDMFEYAQEQGADLTYVSALALDLGRYRQSDNAKYKTPQSQAGHHDLQGRKVVYDFTKKDHDTAKRILNSEELSSTRFDQRYIRHKLNNEYSVLNKIDFNFLEKMINKFSAKGDNVSPFGGKFSSFVEEKDNLVIHTAKERTLKPHGVTGDPLDPALRTKKGRNGKPVAPETLRETLRRIIYKAMSSNSSLISHFRNAVPSLAEFLMRNRR